MNTGSPSRRNKRPRPVGPCARQLPPPGRHGQDQGRATGYDAVRYYTQASAAAPHHEVVVALGDIYSVMGKRDEASKQYALVQVIHDANLAKGVKGNIELARFYADHDQKLSEAVGIAEEEYKTRPNIVTADTLAWCYYKLGRYGDAKKMIEKALSLARRIDAALPCRDDSRELGDRVEAEKFL
jgi:tetratricopeptide (TPR) repeat protein